MSYLISIDPGSEKCGLLLANTDSQTVVNGIIVKSDAVIELIFKWQKKYPIKLIILGNGTNSKFWENKLSALVNIPVHLVDESGTTLRARERFFDISPPGFLLKLLPRGLLFPPKNLDSIAALILLEDYLEKRFNWPGKINLRTWPE